MEVERLVNLAYPTLPDVHRATMALDLFCSSLGHAYLQRHLLAVPTPTLADAVQAGNEYLQIRPTPERSAGNPAVRNMHEDQPGASEGMHLDGVFPYTRTL